MGAGGAIQVQRTVVARTLEVAMDRAPGMKFLMGEVTPVRLLIIQQAPWDCRRHVEEGSLSSSHG